MTTNPFPSSRLWLSLATAFISMFVSLTSLNAQQQYVLIITGLGGESSYKDSFHNAAVLMHDIAAKNWNTPASNIYVLTEDPSRDTNKIKGQSTKEAISQAFLSIASKAVSGDHIFVFLHGHGSGEGSSSKVNITGPDPSASDFATWLSGFRQQTIVFVNAASASGDFINTLSADGRVIITSTKSSVERNDTRFADIFIKGLSSYEADTDKNGSITALEAFLYTERETAREYERENKLLTEHASIGNRDLASSTVFGLSSSSASPEVARIVAERKELENAVSELRRRKDSMSTESYERELERLLISIAEKTRAIRSAGGNP